MTQQLNEPILQLLLLLKQDAETVVQGVNGNDVLVLGVPGVLLLADIETLVQNDVSGGRGSRSPFALAVVILQMGGLVWTQRRVKHEPLFAHRFQFAETGRQNQVGFQIALRILEKKREKGQLVISGLFLVSSQMIWLSF